MEPITAEDVRRVKRAVDRLNELGDRFDDPNVRMTPDQYRDQWELADQEYRDAAAGLRAKGIEDDDDLIAALPDLSESSYLGHVVVDDDDLDVMPPQSLGSGIE